jgi:hypothetical protein
VIDLQGTVVTENFLIGTVRPYMACQDTQGGQECVVGFVEWLVWSRN